MSATAEANSSTRLVDLGERELLRAVIPRYSTSSGDDCEAVEVQHGTLVMTTDPVPPPAAFSIGGSDDPYYAGWLLVTINASDVAAAAADPLSILVAAEFPPDERLDRFERFLLGIRDGCAAEGFAYSGGNLREAAKFSATATAIGWRPQSFTLGRRGASEGDIVVSVGRGGLFWRDAFRLRAGGQVCRDTSKVFKPRSQGPAMRALRDRRLLTSAMDNSDGLLPSLRELGRKNGMSARLVLENMTVPDLPPQSVAGWKLWLGWGDWNCVCTLGPADVEEAKRIARDAGSELVEIGEMIQGDGTVLLWRDNITRPAARLESERFVSDSWFASGIWSYADRLAAYPEVL